MSGPIEHMRELQWLEARDFLRKVNPELTSIIDELNPGREHTIFKVTYPYGDAILKEGVLHLPRSDGGIAPITSQCFGDDIREKLGYNLNSNPVSVILNNSAELFLVLDDRIILNGVFTPGQIFGLWRVLNPGITGHPIFRWSLTSGARSLFMLPKISEKYSHGRLTQAFSIKSDAPESYLDHWHIFKDIVRSKNFENEWSVEILYFSKAWFQNLNDTAWLKFNNYLLNCAWKGSEYLRNQSLWDLIYSLIQKKRNIRPDAYSADTAKHLLSMSIGAFPGFAPANDDAIGPITRLQQAYTDVYGLKGYAPIIMKPATFSAENNSPVYYSLQYPTAMEFSPKSSKRASTMDYLFKIGLLLEKYLLELRSGDMKIEESFLYKTAKHVSFDLFHTATGNLSNVHCSQNMPLEDDAFLNLSPACKNKEFPVASSFVRGCIRISNK